MKANDDIQNLLYKEWLALTALHFNNQYSGVHLTTNPLARGG